MLDLVTLCYVHFECFSLLRNSGIINGSEISNLQNWTVGLVPLEKTPSALRDGLQSPPVSSPSVLARAPAWAIGYSVHPATIIGFKQIEFFDHTGYDRIVGALANLGHSISDQTVGNILRRRSVRPAPEREKSTTWKDFIRSHMSVLAGTDFFTAEVLTWRGLVTYYVLFFIHLDTRKVSIAGITEHPDSAWMEQMGRNVTWEGWGFLQDRRYLLHDRDAKFSDCFRNTVMAGGVKPLKLPASSPNLNSFAERWVRSVREECLSKLVLLGEGSLRRAVGEYVTHFLEERNHQGKGNVLLFPRNEEIIGSRKGRVRCKERLGGLLKYYHREAA